MSYKLAFPLSLTSRTTVYCQLIKPILQSRTNSITTIFPYFRLPKGTQTSFNRSPKVHRRQEGPPDAPDLRFPICRLQYLVVFVSECNSPAGPLERERAQTQNGRARSQRLFNLDLRMLLTLSQCRGLSPGAVTISSIRAISFEHKSKFCNVGRLVDNYIV